MVAGHLQERNGYFHIVLSYQDEYGKRKTKWKTIGLKVKGNKRRAEVMLAEARRQFVPPERLHLSADMLFTDYMEQWLEITKHSIQGITHSSYKSMLKGLLPFFRLCG